MSGKDRRGAGELADEVLGILQAAGEPLLPAEVRERLSGDLAYTTVVTILSRPARSRSRTPLACSREIGRASCRERV